MYLSCVTQVVTEKVRLTDDEAMSAQTTVDGDLYQGFKHQASQGVVSAQVGDVSAQTMVDGDLYR